MVLNWNQVSSAMRYVIHRSTLSGFVPSVQNEIANTTNTQYTDTNLMPSTRYFYKVVAITTKAKLSEEQETKKTELVNYFAVTTPIRQDIVESLFAEELESQEASESTGSGGVFINIIVIASVLSAALFVAVMIYGNSYDPEEYTLTFSGATTYADDRLSLGIDNTGNNLTKDMTIQGIDNDKSRIFGSPFADKSGKILDSDRIKFDGQSNHALENTMNDWDTIRVSMDQMALPRGTYTGQFIISGGSNYSIPVTIESEPKIVQAVMFVSVGVLAAIAIWEIIRYIKYPLDKLQKETLENEALEAAHEAQGKKEGGINQSPEATRLEVMAQVKQQAAAAKTNQLEQYRTKEANPRPVIARIALLEVLSGGVGIAAALIALLNTDYFNGLRVINPQDMLILFGLGLGIGSLKEFSSDK